MSPETSLVRLLDRLYSAALDDSQWPAALDAIARALRAKRAVLCASASTSPPLGADARTVASDGGRSLRTPLPCKPGQTLVVEGPGARRCFSAREVGLCDALAPHLGRCLSIRNRTLDLELQRQALTEAVDRLPFGVVLLDTDGHAVLTNESAHAILEQRDGLAVVAGRLAATRPTEAAALRALLRAQPLVDGAMLVTRPSFAQPYAVAVVPLMACNDAAGRAHDRPVAAVFVSDPETRTQPLETLLTALYGLTPTEGLVSALLMQGMRVEEIARKLAITNNTIRTHLKRVYSKTGATTQSALVRLLFLGPAALRFGRSRSERSAA